MQHFVPANRATPLRILPSAFPALPPAVVRAALALHTRPGDLILDPFCIGTSVIESALELGRKVVAASFSPINLLALQATLFPTDARAAFTRLADARKGPQRLADHVLDLYHTRCPTCDRDALALDVIWNRDDQQPLDKRVHCAACGENLGPCDPADAGNLVNFQARGLPFWLLHSRVLDPKHAEADRVRDVLDAYTPRAQAALSDIVLKFEGLSAADRAALRPALLATFDACTSLHAPGEGQRVIGLKPPPRFVEKNVWLELEQQVERLSQPPAAPPLVQAATVDEVLASPAPAVALLHAPARDLARLLPAQSVALLLAYPPLPRPGFWSLSTVWTAWLWGKSAADALVPLLSRKRTNWDWQWRAIAAGLKVLQPALRPEARTIMAFAGDEAMVESVFIAAAAAGQAVEQVSLDAHDGARVTWRAAAELAAPWPDIAQEAETVLRARAEPTEWSVLHAQVYAALGRTEVLRTAAQLDDTDQLPLAFVRQKIQQAMGGARFQELDGHKWWLTRAENVGPPLADRVEEAARELLLGRYEWPIEELLPALYRRFPDRLTPDRALIAMCVQSYAEEIAPQMVRLRVEDAALARAAEQREVLELLWALGARLGCEVTGGEDRVVWMRGQRVEYAFEVRVTASVLPLLNEAAGALVIPGGRATLLQHKLARDPRLRGRPWSILKFSALRQAAAQGDISLAVLAQAFGLQPPIEQPAQQMALWPLI